MNNNIPIPTPLPNRVPRLHGARVALLLVAIAVVGIGTFSASIIAQQPFIGLRYLLTGEIIEVVPNSPASEAGILFTDHLITLAGLSVDTQDGEISNVAIGETTHATLLRDGQRFDVSFVTRPQPIAERGSHIALIVVAAAFWMIGVGAILRYFLLQAAPHFALFCLAGSASLLILPPAEWSYEWGRSGMYIALSLTGAAFLNVNARFPFRSTTTWQYRLGDIFYVLAAVIALLTLVVGPLQLTQWGNELGVVLLPSRAVRGFFSVSVLISILLLADIYRTAWAQDRQRIRIVFFGTVIGMLPITLVVVAEMLGKLSLPSFVAASIVIVLPLTYTFALSRFGIAQGERRVFQVLVVLATLIVLVGGYYALLSILLRLFPTASLLGLSGVAVLACYPFIVSIQHQIENYLRRLFYMEQRMVDPDIILSKTLQKITVVLDSSSRINVREELVSILSTFLTEELQVFSTAVWVIEGEEWTLIGGDIELYAYEEPQATQCDILDVLRKGEVIEQAPDDKLLTTMPVRYWMPLIVGGRLLGIWAVGVRDHDEPFSIAHQTMLGSVARGTALALNLAQVLDRLHWLNVALGELRESEQVRFANDIHDDIVGPLYALRTALGTVAKQVERGATTPALDLLQTISQQMRSLTEEARDLCYKLRPDVTANSVSLDMALQTLCSKSDRLVPNTSIVYEAWGPVDSLDVSSCVFTALFRGTQEALTNALKHSAATTVLVRLAATDEHLSVTVADDGEGFDSKTILPGIGLSTTQDRITMVGGQRQLQSTLGEGTRITFSVPITQVRDAA